MSVTRQDGQLEAPPPLEALVALNAAVFLAWLALPRRWMARHFEVAAGALARRPWTAAAATVSHANLFDLTGNMQARQCRPPNPMCKSSWIGAGGMWRGRAGPTALGRARGHCEQCQPL